MRTSRLLITICPGGGLKKKSQCDRRGPVSHNFSIKIIWTRWVFVRDSERGAPAPLCIGRSKQWGWVLTLILPSGVKRRKPKLQPTTVIDPQAPPRTKSGLANRVSLLVLKGPGLMVCMMPQSKTRRDSYQLHSRGNRAEDSLPLPHCKPQTRKPEASSQDPRANPSLGAPADVRSGDPIWEREEKSKAGRRQ